MNKDNILKSCEGIIDISTSLYFLSVGLGISSEHKKLADIISSNVLLIRQEAQKIKVEAIQQNE